MFDGLGSAAFAVQQLGVLIRSIFDCETDAVASKVSNPRRCLKNLKASVFIDVTADYILSHRGTDDPAKGSLGDFAITGSCRTTMPRLFPCGGWSKEAGSHWSVVPGVLRLLEYPKPKP